MVGQAAAGLREEVGAAGKGFLHIVHRADFHAGGGAQLFQIGRESGVHEVERLFRAEGGQYGDVKCRVLREQAVIPQVVRRVVRGAQRAHVAFPDERAGRTLPARERLVRLLPDARCALRVQQLVHGKITFQFQV